MREPSLAEMFVEAFTKIKGIDLEGIVAWARTRMTNGFLEALNGLFQAAKRKARCYRNLATIRTIVFLVAGKLKFGTLNPNAD